MPRKRTYSAETEKEIFPSRLRKMMKKRGMNQEALAHLVSVQRQTISLYTIEQSKPDADRLTAIAGALGVSADYLLGLSDIESVDTTTRDICEKTGLSEHTVSRLMQDDNHDKWAEVIDQLILHPGVLDALHAYLFFDVDYFATVENGKASEDHRKVMVLGDSNQKKVVPVYPRMMDGAMQLEVQRELSDLKRQLKKGRENHAKEES